MSRRRPRQPRTARSRRASRVSAIVVLILLLGLYALVQYQRERSTASLPGTPPPATIEPDTLSPATIEPDTLSPATIEPGAPPASWYQVSFTTPRYPDKKEYHRGGLDERLVAFIGTATRTIDLAIYDFDLANVAQALAQAAARGVQVRMVTDTDTLTNDDPAVQQAFAIVKQAGIPIVDERRQPIMHNKFMVVDRATVWTGSWNFTENDTYQLNNNAITIVSPELAQNYTAEFEKMFVQRLFGPNKPAGVPHPALEIGGVRVENYFAPEDRVATHVVDRLKAARQSIHFLAFSFTSDPIADALLERAEAGVPVAGVFETTGSETRFSEYGRLKQAGLDVLQDGNPYPMHHKVFIIDGRTAIFGSYNFSANADTDNDENLLIIDDPALAQAFEAEFQRVRETALRPPRK